MKLRFSSDELKDLLKAWVAISVAFAVLMSGDNPFWIMLIVSALTVGIGFLFHELAHKFFAQRYGLIAEFRAFNAMLLIAVGLSFFGFIIAAPGAVFIRGSIDRIKNGKISAAGPAANIILAFLLFIIAFIIPYDFLFPFILYGSYINAMLALFNLIPFGIFDGSKIFKWNKMVYISMVVLGVVAMMLPNIVSMILSNFSAGPEVLTLNIPPLESMGNATSGTMTIPVTISS